MGAIISAIAFPYPPKHYSEDALRSRQDLKFLKTKTGIQIPCVHITKCGAKFTIIYSHGNAEDVGLSLNYLDVISDTLDASVIAYEYPGYSISGGRPSEKNCYEAIDAAYKYATETARIDPSQIILYGRSLGTGPTVDLCSRSPNVSGCILQSPLESGIRCFIGVCSSYTLYPLDIFRNYSKIELIQCPVFIMHGMDDGVVPCNNGRALYAQLQERPIHSSVQYPPLWIPNRGHNDIPEEIVLNSSRKFLKFLETRESS